MKYTSIMVRSLGHVLRFPSTKVSDLISHKKQILKGVEDHGCICIKNVNLKQQQQIEFTKGTWKQMVQLPAMFAFLNKNQAYPQIVRVGNVKIDGTIRQVEKQQSTAWHQDGDFWPEDKKHIFSCLQSKEQPQGGDTIFMDLIKGAQFLKKKRPEIYKKLGRSVGILNLLQIADFKRNNAENILGVETISKHNLIRTDKNGRQMLYLSAQKIVDKQTMNQTDLKFEQIISLLQKQIGVYTHKWQKGDMLIWDNLQVIHRASGYFKGRRLLLRTQGRL